MFLNSTFHLFVPATKLFPRTFIFSQTFKSLILIKNLAWIFSESKEFILLNEALHPGRTLSGRARFF
jgi:hypothetical protein